MWNLSAGNNYIRLLDEGNSMKRHYKKLKEIKKRNKRPNFINTRYNREKSKPQRHTKVKINRAKEIYNDNKKMLNALDRISKRWGELGPNSFLKDQEMIKQKTLGFKKKSNQDMIKENIRYLEKMKAVKPVYNKKMFEDEEKNYLYLKRNIKISNGKYRKLQKKSFSKNEKEVKRIKKARPKSAGFALMQRTIEEGNEGEDDIPLKVRRSKSVIKLNKNKVLIVDDKKPRSRYYGLGLNKRPRSALFMKDGRVKKPKFSAKSESQIIVI